jgi:hypothetical protein
MAKETILTKFTLLGREILSSYASMTLEGVMTARVAQGKDAWTIEERNGIAKGTSDGENEAIYIPNDKAIASIRKNIVPLLPKKVVIKTSSGTPVRTRNYGAATPASLHPPCSSSSCSRPRVSNRGKF